MEFNEKLQELRKQNGLTQEELAEKLFVSRTAVSKWESGRGYPNIDSIKAIAKFFSVTVDELLSGGEVLDIAEEDNRQKEKHFCDIVFGLLDISAAMFFFVPFFGQEADGIIEGVSLLSLCKVQPYMKATYFAIVILTVASGVLTLALQNCGFAFRERNKNKISLMLNGAGIVLFIMSLQPYAAVYLFVLLTIKALLLIKQK